MKTLAALLFAAALMACGGKSTQTNTVPTDNAGTTGSDTTAPVDGTGGTTYGGATTTPPPAEEPADPAPRRTLRTRALARQARNRRAAHDPLSKTTIQTPSGSLRHTELKRPTVAPDGSLTGPDVRANCPDDKTSTRSGCHENGASAPSKKGAQAAAMTSRPRRGSLPLKKTASGAMNVRKA